MKFPIENFIDISSFKFSDIFAGKENGWEALPEIENYILNLFKNGKIKANYKKSDCIYVGEGTKIMQGTEIIGPAIIGNNCFISNSVLIRNNCLIGDNVQIGHGCEVKNSIFLDNSAAAHLNYVGDSIVGNKVNISGGAIIANYRLDKKPVTVSHENKKYETGLVKFGALIGDNTTVGVNSVLNPGTILGKNSIVFPLTCVSGVHGENEIIK